MKCDAVLYYTHFCSPVVLREIDRLRRELDERYDVFAVGYSQSKAALSSITQVAAFAYTACDLSALPYSYKLGAFQSYGPHSSRPLLLQYSGLRRHGRSFPEPSSTARPLPTITYSGPSAASPTCCGIR
jgi:hypothetical protein